MIKNELYGWTGKIIWVDLSSNSIEVKSSKPYFEKYLGGRGFAAKIAWDYIKPGTGPFDHDNVLMFLSGPLAGSCAPYSGRGIVCGVSPHSSPEWFTRSGFGGHWTSELKYAGYDGVILTGKSVEPVYLLIEDDRVEIRSAQHLWGKGTIATQKMLINELGEGIRIMTIGPAGENLSRLAIINTETESAAGQGGFGAVMGAKKLKAIAVRGSGGVNVAHSGRLIKRSKQIAKIIMGSHHQPKKGTLDKEKVKKYGEQFQACTQQCMIKCIHSKYYRNVPGCVYQKEYSGQLHCVSHLFQGDKNMQLYDWDIGFEAGFEIAQIANDLGLNHWELIFGLVPWLRECKQKGILGFINNIEINADSPRFWIELLNMIAYRNGIGDILAEGGIRAAKKLGGTELIQKYYTAWGFGGHWDGHADHANYIVFPYWLVTALLWATDTRDPMSSTHGYVQAIMNCSPLAQDGGVLNLKQILSVGKYLYNSEKAIAPDSGYADKEIPAVYHSHRSVIKDSLLLDDQIFPVMFNKDEKDGIPKAGDIKSSSFEYHLFVDTTGLEMSEGDFNKAAERIYNLERLIQIRNYKRDRRKDEEIISAFEKEENWENQVLGEKYSLNVKEFKKLLNRYYELRGWDPKTGWPTREKLKELELEDGVNFINERLKKG